MIPNPYYRFNEDSIQWVERKDWEYATTFKVSKLIFNKKYVELTFEGLDTYCDVYLNDSLLFRDDNMFIAHTINVKPYLLKGNNRLRLYFHSPVNEGMKKLKQINYILRVSNEQAPIGQQTNIFTRKAPFHYGWDWGPRIVTSGIWRSVFFKAYDDCKIEDVYFAPKEISNEKAVYDAYIEIKGDSIPLKIHVLINGVLVAEKLTSGSVLVPFSINNPKLWWTWDLGNPYLYKIEIQIFKKEAIIDSKTLELGVRKLELIQDSTLNGRTFYFKLNGVAVFSRGANYIPPDILKPSGHIDKYERVLNDAIGANMNMLRVWGGAIYEDDIFYSLCDKKGVLIWHDFMFACGLVQGDTGHLNDIRKEAEYNVKRLRNHPCMALWCGNNENLIAWYNWNWRNNYDTEILKFLYQTYRKVFLDILSLGC